ncbi:MAG: hypothetical protein U0P30_00665 [Vicinamibacterales bacterium]
MTDQRDAMNDDAMRRAYGASIAEAAGPHISEDDWVRLASDDVRDDERVAFADHIAQCAACADTWRAVSEVRAGASAFDPAAPRPTSARAVFAVGRWAGLAAAAVVVLAVAATLQRRDPASSVSEAPQSPPEGAAQAPAEPPPAPAVTPRAWAALPAAPAVTLPASLALTTRGTSPDADAFLAAFGPAIAPYRAGRYAEAATALEALTARAGGVPEVWFYLGVSRLLSGQAAEAVPALARASTSDAVGAQAVWLRVVALERAGRVDEATTALRASCATATLDAHRAACATLAPTR